MIPPTDWALIAGLTAGCALAGWIAGVLVLRAARRRTVTAHIVLASLASLATVAAAVLLTMQQMFLSNHDSTVVLVVIALSLPAAAGVAAVLGSTLREASRRLVGAAERIGQDGYRRPSSPPTAELRSLADAIDEAHRRLSEAHTREAVVEQSRRALVAGMSHDLRTPLAGMRAMVESLEDGLASDRATVERYHRQLRIEVDRLAAMVSDLFELSRVQGALQLNLERVGAQDLVDEAMASAHPMAQAKGVRLVSSNGTGVPVVVDPAELGRALRNLLLNAIRHTPSEGTIHVTLEPDDTHVSLAVSDTCGGIPEADLPRVFDTSFRGGATRDATSDKGGGLGLAIARGIVEAHAGNIRVVNHDAGCRFEVRLPLATEVRSA